MATITTPAAGVSPYPAAAAAPTVLRAAADGTTVLADAADAAAAATVTALAEANANTLVVVSGQAALNSLITSGQPGVFDGANVTINLEEQNFNTTNQVTSTINSPSGSTGEIQYNSGDNSFASDPYFTYTNSNVVTPGIRTNNYLYGNGAPFIGGGNAAIGNFVFSGDTMSISDDANISLTIQGNSLGNNLNQIIINPTSVDLYAFNNSPYSYAELYLDNTNTEEPVAQIIVDGNSTPTQIWTFNNVGNLTLPSNTSSINYANGSPYGGGSNYSNSNVSSFLAAFGSNVVSTTGNITGNFFIGNGSQLTGVVSSYGNANVVANLAALGSNPVSTTGNITGNYFIGNGSQLTGIVANTGNVTFSSEIVIGTGTSNLISGLYLAPSSSSANANMYLRVRGNIVDEPTHIHFDTGNNAYYNQFIGDDNKYIQLANTGNIVINSNDGVGNSAQWNFDYNGILTLPGNSRVAPAGANIELQAAAGGYAVIVTSDGNNYVAVTTSGAEIVTSGVYAWTFNNAGNLTLPGNTFAVNYANGSPVVISGGAAGLPLANGTSNINIATANGNVTVTANATTWTFGSNSKITLPNGASLNDTSGDSVAFGQNAGLTSQAQHAVAIGINAGRLYQGEDSIAIGYNAGYYDQQRGVAIGWDAGEGGTLTKSVSDAQGGSGPVTTYDPVQAPNPSRLYVTSTADIVTNQRVFGNNIQANTLVTAVYAGEDRVDIAPDYTAAMSPGDTLTFVGLVIGLNNATNLVQGMRATGTDIPANTFVQSTGCSVVTLNQYPTAPLTDGASIVFTVGQGFGATAIGYQAGSSFQDDNAVAVGRQAGYNTQGANAVAVGGLAGYNTQNINAVAVGYKAGYSTQGARAVAIGEDAGFQTQGEDAVAVGQKAGFQSQGPFAVAIGNSAGRSGQLDAAVAIGYGTGAVSQGYSAVAIGANAASYAQGSSAVAIGELSGNTSQGSDSVAVGYRAGLYNQLPAAVAIGYAAGQNFQGTQAVAIGDSAGAAGTTFSILYQSGSGTAITISPSADIRIGQRITGDFVPDDTFVVNIDPTGEFLDLSQAITGTPDPGTEWTAWQPQGIAAVAIGYAAGQNLQGNSAVAVGDHSGYQDQGINAVAVGYNAGYDTQGTRAVAIGEDAGFLAQGANSVSIGFSAGNTTQGIEAVAIGYLAGGNVQGNSAVAVGTAAGYDTQGIYSVAVGPGAGQISQGSYSVAIGVGTGYDTQGANSIAIGGLAGQSAQGNNSIIINATGAGLNQTTANTFTVKPVRGDSIANLTGAGFKTVYYNSSTGEFAYSTD